MSDNGWNGPMGYDPGSEELLRMIGYVLAAFGAGVLASAAFLLRRKTR